jgi:4-amino-4-deoxy-L-arabinose transferase-like glycosyltransferase
MPGSETGHRRSALIWIGLINLGLLALFVWALTERTTLRIESTAGECTAILDGRTNSTPCPDLEGGQIGLTIVGSGDLERLTSDPWRLIAPASSWRRLSISRSDGSETVELLDAGRPAANAIGGDSWRTVAGELWSLSDQATIHWPNPLTGDFRLEADLRRPGNNAGILLLQPDGTSGWLFLYSSGTRLGTWWRWSDGRAVEPLLGAPLQKSLTAQIQSLMRQMLVGHQAGLLLLLASWLLALFLAWTAKRIGQKRAEPPGDPIQTSRRNSGRRGRAHERAALVALILLVFGGSLFIAGDLLDGQPHVQDSITYRFQGQTLARGRLTAPAPPEPEPFEQEFLLVEDGRWFGKYPPGYPLLLAPAELLGLPWLVNPLLAALTLALLFALGKAWFGRRVGLLAALLAAVSPFFMIMSGTFMAHPAELFWLTLFMVAWTQVIRDKEVAMSRRLPWLIAGGVALGMAFLTRQLTTMAIAGAFILITLALQPGIRVWRQRLKDLLALALVTAPFILLLLAYQWLVTGDPLQDPRLLFWPYDHLGFGQDIGQGQNVVTFETIQGDTILVWQHDPQQPPRGHTPARGVFNMERNWRHLQSHLFGWLPVFSLAFAWIVFASGRARRADWVFLFTAMSLMIVYVFYWADGVSYGPRYLYAALPALLLLVARGIQTTVDLIGGRAGKWATGLILTLFIAGGLFLYSPGVLADLKEYNFVDGANLAAVEKSLDDRALVFVGRENGDWWEYGNYFIGNTPWLDGRIIYARDLGAANNARLQANYPDRDAYLLQNGRLTRLESGG